MRSKTTVFWFFSGVAVLLLIVGSILLFHNGKKEDKSKGTTAESLPEKQKQTPDGRLLHVVCVNRSC